MKLFKLYRKVDITGISGVGYVAEGVIFENNKVILCWYGKVSSIVVYDNLEDMKSIISHNNNTDIHYL